MSSSGRGHLRVYLGAAPGVGKTYKMLGEAQRRRERGTDIVVGLVETHGREHTAAMLEGLEVVPRKIIDYRGASFTELDLDAVLARRPEVVLVDELAHSNIPGSRNAKRWQDIDELLTAGIDVISAVNIQHLESINDVVEKITGVPQQETVPDRVVRAADQIELVDMTPEALRRRMAHGNVYAADKIDAALGNYFRVGNLSALRELALLWLADRVDAGLQQYRSQHDIDSTWEARERVVVALTGGPEGETLIRRAARIAARSSGGDLLAVHVARSDGLTGANPAKLAQQRQLVESLGGTYHQVVGEDVPECPAGVRARRERDPAGARRQPALPAPRRCSPVRGSARARSGTRATSTSTSSRTRRWAAAGCRGCTGSLSRRRLIYGFVLAVVLPPALAAAARPRRRHAQPDQQRARLPVRRRRGRAGRRALAGDADRDRRHAGPELVLHAADPVPSRSPSRTTRSRWASSCWSPRLVSSVVDRAARRTRQAARSAAESETLATLAGSVLRGETALPALLERVREAFGMTGACLMERVETDELTETWRPIASAGTPTCRRPEEGDAEIPARDDLVLVLQGRSLAADERRLVGAFAAHAAALVDRARLSEAAAEAKPLAEADKLRTALLARRRPRSAVAAGLGEGVGDQPAQLRRRVESRSERDELLETADESLDRLTRLVDNLLDLSRLQAGVLPVFTRPMALDEILPGVLAELGDAADSVTVDLPHTLPLVDADPALLERVIANLLANAVRHSPAGRAPLVTGSSLGDQVEIRVMDRGPGIPRADRDRVFAPFQRLGDTDNTTGVGLGLALARGLTEAMSGSLQPGGHPGRWADHGRLVAGGNLTAGRRAGARKPRARRGGAARMTRILVVDDEPQIVRALQINLKARRYEVHVAGSGTAALKVAAQYPPDLVILDLGLPDFDGVDVIRGLRGWTEAPILVLSGRTDSTDKVEALDAGADDYVTKPFGIDELLARMRAVLRRSNLAQDQPVVTVGGAQVDLAAKRVTLDSGEDVRLTPTEWHLLEVLVRHPGKLMSQRQLLTEVWGPGYESASGNLRFYMGQLRRKLEADPARPLHLLHRARHGLPLRALGLRALGEACR